MNVPEVQDIAKTISTVSDVLKGVSTALGVIANLLKATAFVGLVGNLAEAHFIEVVKKQLDDMASKCSQLSKDVQDAVQAYQNGDAEGSQKFH
jgi:hypothetical protein